MSIAQNFGNTKPSLLLDFANTKQLDPRITFTRASTGGFYNGVTTAMAEQNLLTYSQDVSNAAWQKASTTATADSTTAPDGTTTADTVTASAATAAHYVAQNVTVALSTNITHSFYAKAGTQNYVQLAAGAEGGFYANFDLSTGVVGTSAGAVSTSIVSAGSGWYRCIATVLSTVSSTSLVISAIPTTSSTRIPSWAAVGTETFYLWGAQTEQRSAVTAYTVTTSQAITNYIPVLQSAASGVARFDHNPTTGESLGLLIEEQRTNLQIYSQDFSDASYSKTACSILSNVAIAPDGTLTADRIVEDTTTGIHRVFGNVSAIVNVAYSFSCYAKLGNGTRNLQLLLGSGFGETKAMFNLSTGIVISTNATTASIISVGNGWYRCAITGTSNATGSITTQIYNTTSFDSYTGDGYSGNFIWGAQFEQGSFATSYIPTVASQVTRAADAASMTGTNFSTWYNSGEGTMYAEAIAPSTTTNTSVGIVELSNSASAASNYIAIYRQSATWRFRTNLANLNLNPFPTDGSFNKMAFGYSATSYPISVNNTAVQTNTTTGLISGVNQLLIGFASITASPLSGTIKKLAYYPIRLSNTNLQALTS